MWLQVGDLRKKDMIFKLTDGDIMRGKIGLGTNNIIGVWFSAVTVDPKTKVTMPEVRTYDHCLAKATESHIHK